MSKYYKEQGDLYLGII